MRSLLPILLLIVSACAPTRRTTTIVTEVRDTTHVTVHDTLRITQVHDSIVFRATEHIREQEVTTFDPTTGQPIQHQLTRDIDRDLQALIRHIADSLMAAHSTDSLSSSDTDTTLHDEAARDAAPSLWQRIVQKVSTLFCLLVVIAMIVVAVRIYSGRGKTPSK